MREFINIVEAIEDQTTLSDAYEIISEYVTHGEIQPRDRAYFDAKFEQLMTLLPRPDHAPPLYRFLRLSDEQLAAIGKGGLVLEMRQFSSWARSLNAVKNIARKKQGEGHPVIVEARFPAREIVVDVADFYDDHSFNSGDFNEYHKYVRPEQEVIVRHHAPIRLTPQNTIPLEREVTIEPPKIGDRFFWDDEDENGIEIEDVDYDQPYADRGVFYVTPEQHDSTPVRNVGPGEWEYFEIEQ